MIGSPSPTAHQLGAAKRAGQLDDKLERFGCIPLLIVAEVGYIPFDPQPRHCPSS